MTRREDRATITAIIGVSSLLSELPLWEAEEVSCVVTTMLKFLSVVSASVLGTVARGTDGVTLGSREGAGGTGTVVPGVEEVLRLPLVALGDILAAVVGGGFGAVVETVPGVLMLSLLAPGVVPSSGPGVGALVGLLREVDAVVGGSVVMLLAPTLIRPLPSKRRKNHKSMLTLIIISQSSTCTSLGAHKGSSSAAPLQGTFIHLFASPTRRPKLFQ